MKRISIIIASMAVVSATAVIACNSDKSASKTSEGEALVEGTSEVSGKETLIKRGEYLVTIMGCQDCHSPKVMTPQGPAIDSAHMLSGHPFSLAVPKVDPSQLQSWVLFNHNNTAFVGPWCISFASNITSDETGIGNWTEAQFLKAIREGKYKGMDNTRPLLPPMPWNVYRRATDDDLKAIFAYLKSTAPVANRVPAAVPP
ncbi:MAG TPA: diheme cytochrome c-553, partial [Flavisolibacter sp.]|nr:diheme cytochrome c-553 [Flavisolibacter sp.]